MISDHTHRRVLEVLENRDPQTLTEDLQQARQSGLLASVTEVTTDMWDGYVNASKAAFGENVAVVSDRRRQLKPLDAFCQTLENWLPMIANYFTNRSSNGPTEGFNRGFRTILWQAFGMTNFRHFRLRILDRFNQPLTQLST